MVTTETSTRQELSALYLVLLKLACIDSPERSVKYAVSLASYPVSVPAVTLEACSLCTSVFA